MRKKRWFFIATLVAVVIGVSGGTVMAQETQKQGGSPLESFVSRVATILGIGEEQVQAAFDQAAKEMQDERLQRRLDEEVASGRITQEQADEYKKWYDSRPPSLWPRNGGPKFGPRGRRHGRGWGKHGPDRRSRPPGGPESAPQASGTSV